MEKYRIDYYADAWSCELLQREYIEATSEDNAKALGMSRMEKFNSKYITCNVVK